MNTHEYQAKEILKTYGVPIPDFAVISKPQEALSVIQTLKLKEAVIKIQVHAGGRGKAGGVKFGKSPEDIEKIATTLLGMKMVNHQTGPQGVIANLVMISRPISIAKEYYLGIVMDREKKGPVLIASPEGGMDIEEIAAKHPDKILTLPVGLNGKIRSYHLLYLAKFMGWSGGCATEGIEITKALALCFVEKDASLLEINPLVKSQEGKLWALDAKLSVDDNALFRQTEIASFYDPTQENPNEVAAKKYDLAYIPLEGNIGCMVNGAGLAMATMDIIKHEGGSPANFLDVGGSATVEKITEGFKILMGDPQVKAVLVNIFGGIMNCATIAEGIITAASQINIRVPLVVRMEGTNVEVGKKMLQDSGLPIQTADDLKQAAKKVVEAC